MSDQSLLRDGWLPGVRELSFGGDYNPEQWPQEIWAQDLDLMRRAGVNIVSIGIFSWGLLEPRPGEFDFAWLDAVIEGLHEAGIRVDLGTPTTVPPQWFWQQNPHVRPVLRDGTVLAPGSRGICCPSSPEYAQASLRITTELAQRYGKHPAVVLWHVHNEYGAPISECYCEVSAAAFRVWLQARYGTLDALNTAWGTAFWGQTYGDWAQVGTPAQSASMSNPAHRLDFARFSSDELLGCFTRERDVLHEKSPGVPVTTNFMATNCPSMDLWKWSREVDVVANDHYLTAADPRSQVGLALDADLTRSLADGRPWMLMEHSSSAVNWQPRNLAKRPGELARNSLSHLARGADAILFFQWRASRRGAEKFHSAMLPHAGENSRVFREVTELGATLGSLTDVLDSRVQAPVAILWDWESLWAQDLDWRPSVDLEPRRQVREYYERLWHDKVTVDFAHPTADLSRYAVVLAPASYLLTGEAAANLTAYVEAGGHLVVGPFSGVVDQDDAVHPGGWNGVLRDLLQVSVEEVLPLPENGAVTLTGGTRAGVWAEDLAPQNAETVLEYTDGPAAGRPAVTRRALGGGTATYVSTVLDHHALTVVLDPVLERAGVTIDRDLPWDLEIVSRHGADGSEYVFAINHAGAPADLPVEGVDLLTGEPCTGSTKIPAGAVRVFRR
ncbi:beta-galactosidase [Kineosporia sp. NBRC 101731]|uniref:beta-galactosidase n=1 Tax=Kineosporia sp. NBRC 101731 TaxID=3032199 RepID=UPI0024A36F34|nr:beta-galactosidase [Kineosporia sp. NBRC 101731]GLY31902.1 beta-galactosidase [Kineosporia sp. NBRC 101731]